MVCNLQIITIRENSSKDRFNKTGFTGVYKNKNRYIATIKKGDKIFNLGNYVTPEEASEKYNQALILIDNDEDISHLIRTRKNANSFIGVSKIGSKFKARICINDKYINLGYYETAEMAGMAYKKALEIKKSGGELIGCENKINKSGFRGVYKSGSKFRARICIDGFNKNLGTFDTQEKASEIFELAFYLKKEKKSIGHLIKK
jgi:hypothetical protein